MRILIIGAAANSLFIFRGPLIRKMTQLGHEVFASAGLRDWETYKQVKTTGAIFHPIRISRTRLNPLHDFGTIADLMRLMCRLRPEMVLAYNIKPVIYGGLVARLCHVPDFCAMITGLGFAFGNESGSFTQRVLGHLARCLYRLSLKGSRVVLFQNPDDRGFFLKNGLVPAGRDVQVHGSGVDCDHYGASPLPDEPVFLMIGRLIAAKGVREYTAAARFIREHNPESRFLLIGAFDSGASPVGRDVINKPVRDGFLDVMGWQKDVRPWFRKCRCFVLPSYYEGMPRSVLEAMAMGRPVITTDVAGCRETVWLTPEGMDARKRGDAVMRGENGFLVRPQDTEALIEAMRRFMAEPRDSVARMAARSREIAVEKFDVHKVDAAILRVMGLG